MWVIWILTLLWTVHKWIYYRLTVKAILLYYAECGLEIPDNTVIQEYRIKVSEKCLKH